MRIHFTEIQEIAAQVGLEPVGVASAELLESEIPRLAQWQDQGCAGEMQYMVRAPKLLASPQELLPGARSVIQFTVPYANGPHPALPQGYGRVARYAWGKDYHHVLPRALAEFSQALRLRVGPGCEVRAFTDAVPLLERALAAKARLGFIGKNTMLIRPREGSFFFIAEVLTTLEVYGAGLPVVRGGCGECARCVEQCPTGAIDQAYRVDARRCISYLTIEKRGVLPEPERSMVGEWVFGCDICQEVCPFNHRAHVGRGPVVRHEFAPDQGVGPIIDLTAVLRVRTAAEFESRFGHTPLMRTRRAGLLRNAAMVAANTRAATTIGALLDAAREDPSPIVRLHCAAAMCVLHPGLAAAEQRAVRRVLETLRADPDGQVAGEIQRRLDEGI